MTWHLKLKIIGVMFGLFVLTLLLALGIFYLFLKVAGVNV